MNKTITIAIILAAALGGIIYLAARSSGLNQIKNISASLGSLTPLSDNYNFGIISMSNGNVTHDFSLKNDGDDPLIIKKIYTSCMCTHAKVVTKEGKEYGPFGMPGHEHGIITPKANIEIGPGEDFKVVAIFDPTTHGPSGVGLNQRAIYIETNSEKTPKVELSFEANVTP